MVYVAEIKRNKANYLGGFVMSCTRKRPGPQRANAPIRVQSKSNKLFYFMLTEDFLKQLKDCTDGTEYHPFKGSYYRAGSYGLSVFKIVRGRMNDLKKK